MNKKTKIIIITAAALVVIAAIIAIVLAGFGNDEPSEPQSESIEEIAENETPDSKDSSDVIDESGNADSDDADEKVYTPTFMYFVSNDDADFDKTNEVISRLKNEYDGMVTFDIRNVTDDPSQLESFPVEGQTPALIMLNTKNDISNFLFQNGNYDDLKAAIDSALQ